MKAKIILSDYPYYLTTDVGSTTSVDISQLRFLDEIRSEKLEELLNNK